MAKMKEDGEGKSKVFTPEEVIQHSKIDDCWIIIDKKVYDVTKWLPFHPGGTQILANLGGRDVTDLFNGMHDTKVQNKLPRFYIGDLTAYNESDFIKDFRKLARSIIDEGFYESDFLWYFLKTVISFLILGLSISGYVSGFYYNCELLQLGGAVLFGLYLQQTAFLGHDTGHNGITHNIYWDTLYGMLVGPFMTGISASWWKHSHNIHHSVPNTYPCDPDIQHLPFFAVSRDSFKSVYSSYHKRLMVFDRLAQFAVSYQHILFYPVLALARFYYYTLSFTQIFFKQCEWRKTELLGIVIFWSSFSYLHSYCLSWQTWFLCLLLSHVVCGILHVQTCLSHFSADVISEVPYKNDDEQFIDTQLRTTMDVDNPWWLDWFHGGLQFQTTHHLFPRVPRHNLRSLRRRVEILCVKHGRKYNSATFLEANVLVVRRLRKTALEASAGKFIRFKDSMIWEGLTTLG